MISTSLTKLLGISVPIVQGGMQCSGILTALTQPSPEALRTAIRETKSLTSKPIGVNITLLPTINPPDYAGYARVAVEEGIRIFETAGNNPGPLIRYFKSEGCIVLHKCTTIRHAKSAEKHGVDVLSIDGFECAGHPGEEDIGGLVLLARAAKELKIPYIASGGIADGRGLAAALALGAAQKIVASTEQDTVHIFRTLNNTHALKLERRPGGAKFEDLRELVSGQRGKMVYENGDSDYGIWSAGITIGLIDDIPTCDALLRRMVGEAEQIINDMRSLVEVKSKL
ncbi:inosine monophosphate dehydrogenase [Infundibulicybe gibba]|nr:inosine monophosphate dehydrogenase [Infundibulicybe gibba]